MAARMAELIEASPAPRTRASLAFDLAAVGIKPGSTVLVHSSLSALGWVAGGPPTVILALMDIIGSSGTLVMPTFTPEISDPAEWTYPPVPKDWVEELRNSLPIFDPQRTPTAMGSIPDLFRTWPGVSRSEHPQASVAAWGKDAPFVTGEQPLAWALGDDGPLGRIYELDGLVLLLGVGHNRNSSLHLAETRAVKGRRKTCRMPLANADGTRRWVDVPDVGDDHGVYFERIGADFESTGAVRIGMVGSARARLMRQRPLVDFAARWLDDELTTKHEQIKREPR